VKIALLSILALVSFAKPCFASCELVTDKLLYTIEFKLADNVPTVLTEAVENSIANANRLAGSKVFALNKQILVSSANIGHDNVSTISAAGATDTAAYYTHGKIYEIDISVDFDSELNARDVESKLTTALDNYVCH
jgi:hypothetical protein